jgi:hypothetical protein
MDPMPGAPGATLATLPPPPLAAADAAASEPSASEAAGVTQRGTCGTSRYKGVSWYSQRGMWRAEIRISGKKHRLGYFHSEDDAARKYDEFAAPQGRPLNFPAPGTHCVVKGGRGGTSGFKGVSWHKKKKKWVAQIMISGKVTYLGYFDVEEDAARKFDEVAAPLGRVINFPSEFMGAAVAGSARPGVNGDHVRKDPPASSMEAPQAKIARMRKLSMPAHSPAAAQTAVALVHASTHALSAGDMVLSESTDPPFNLPQTSEVSTTTPTEI